MSDETGKQTGVEPPDGMQEWNGRGVPEDLALPSPSPRFRHCSGSTTPTRTPTPTQEGAFGRGDDLEHQPVVKTKSVSFHSHTNWKSDRRIQNAQDCLQYMMEGSSMIKLRSNGRQYHRYFRLLQDLSAITWAPSSKKSSRAQVPIEQMKEIRTGRHCESLRNKHFPPYYNEERIFSILYEPAYDSLDLIACTPDEANIWVNGLNALIGASQSPESVDETQTLRESWLRDNFVQATRDTNGYIDQTTCIQLIRKLDQQVATDKVKQKILEFDHEKADKCRGRIELDEFIDMFKEVATRPEIYFLMIRYANKDNLTREDFHLFLEGEQGMCGLTEEKVSQMILTYEPAPEARRCGQLLIDGFTKYLLSEECDIFDQSHRQVCQDMTQPLSHYFISTSHNTYLLEDQLKGPSSVDGYIRVLSCGCRCVKVDVWDGVDEPQVYHGNTLTSKVPFRDVVDAIASYSFDYSVYPVFVHLENHCSIKQQKIMAEIIKTILGKHLYVHPKTSPKNLCELSPESLKFKIILKGKKLAGNEPEGEVTDEDEGGETKRNNNPRKIKLCRELSSLISLSRSRSLEFPIISANKDTSNTMWSVSESTMGKLCHSKAEELVQHNKNSITRIFPNSSRVDSSNYNPQDFWNVGCQMVALNFQTPGQMMDVYEGKFRANGACGYILKPEVMREHISVFSTNSKDSIPGVAPQILKVKIISGQGLPKPSGSTAVKASVIDPYVVIQVFGIPSDCAEDKTRTISNDGSSPIFDESFDFLINLPELALVRFVVLDDEFIGDDFIGQCTIPFDCIQTGYRHIRLLSSMGEPLPNATLFVHVSISNKRGGKSHKGWGRKRQKLRVNLKFLGLKVADDIFKETVPFLSDAELRQEAVEAAWTELQEECGLGHTANIKQCLKVIISRFTSQPDGHNLFIIAENEVPFLRSSKPEPLPSHLHKLTSALDRLMVEMHQFRSEMPTMKQHLQQHLEPSLKLYDELDSLMASHGIKGKKANKCIENFAYNVRMIRGQLDRLESLEKKCKVAFEQMESTKVTLKTLNLRERSPSVRDRSKLNLQNRHNTSENLSYDSLGRTPTSPIPLDCKPKSILKKSNSNIESNSQGYVDPPSPESPHGLLKPPLHHSLSYTPGITAKGNYDPPSVEYIDESCADAFCFKSVEKTESKFRSLDETCSASSHTFNVDIDSSTAL